jgi:hypothetical protein
MMAQDSYFVWVGGDRDSRFQLLGSVTGKGGICFVQRDYAFGVYCDAYLVEEQALPQFWSWVAQCHCVIVNYTRR